MTRTINIPFNQIGYHVPHFKGPGASRGIELSILLSTLYHPSDRNTSLIGVSLDKSIGYPDERFSAFAMISLLLHGSIKREDYF